jgi:hypothetical protein
VLDLATGRPAMPFAPVSSVKTKMDESATGISYTSGIQRLRLHSADATRVQKTRN